MGNHTCDLVLSGSIRYLYLLAIIIKEINNISNPAMYILVLLNILLYSIIYKAVCEWFYSFFNKVIVWNTNRNSKPYSSWLIAQACENWPWWPWGTKPVARCSNIELSGRTSLHQHVPLNNNSSSSPSVLCSTNWR